MRQNTATKKLVLAGVLTALAVVGSLISFPIAGSKCAPVQHMVNILAAVTLGRMGRRNRIYGEPSAQYPGHWKPSGISGQHGGSTLLRTGLCGLEKAGAHLCG